MINIIHFFRAKASEIKESLKSDLESRLVPGVITPHSRKVVTIADLLSDVLVGDRKSKLNFFDELTLKSYMEHVGKYLPN